MRAVPDSVKRASVRRRRAVAAARPARSLASDDRHGAGRLYRFTPTKLLLGQILVVLAIVVLGVWTATQWAAAMLGYQPRLGDPWFVAGGWPFYRPWALFVWWFRFEAYAPEVFDRAGALAAASG